MSIAAESGVAPSTVPDAAARVLLFTQAARPGDLPLILGALSAAELNAGLVALGPRVPPAVIDHVIAHGPRAARRTLAWQLRVPGPRAGASAQGTAPYLESARRRLLSRAEPDLDRALFGRLEQVGVAWVRSAILRDRVGPDGEAIVPAGLRAELVDFLGTASLPLSPEHLADTNTGDPEFELLRVLAGARDFGLSLPASRVLGLPGPIPASRAGWRDQAWVQGWDRAGAGARAYRVDWDEILELAADHEELAGDRGRFLGRIAGLDEAAAREDIPEDVRRQVVAGYPQAAWHAAAPTVTTLRRVATAVAQLRQRWGSFEEQPEFREAIKDLIVRGLTHGSLTAEEVVEHALPASAVLDLAWRSADEVLPAASGRAELAGRIGALLDRRLGDDVPLWYALLLRSYVWTGTVAELIDSTAVLGPAQAMPDADEFEDAPDVPSANVLLAFARPHVSQAILSDGTGWAESFKLELLQGRPLSPELVARVFAPDAPPQARWALTVNPATPAGALQRLLHDTVDPMNTLFSLVMVAPGPQIRHAALELLEQKKLGWDLIMAVLEDLSEVSAYQLVAAAPNAERLHFLLKKLRRNLGPDTSALLYGRLAAEAGPEPVWDAARAVAGPFREVLPFVRASMAAGDAEPVLKAAEAAARQDIPGVTVLDPETAYHPHPDDPARWPLENAVRQHLDNRPHRWRIMVRRLMAAGPLEYAQLADLVEAVGEGVGEAVEGEP